MTVSYSDFGIYRRCPRQWAYKMMAQWNASDGRREIYLLKQLQSLSAWRGTLVDGIISDFLLPVWAKGGAVSLDFALGEARRRVELQLEFGQAHRAREAGMSKAKGGEEFASFYDVEYNGSLNESEIERAREEIELALRNLFEMDELIQTLRSAPFLKAQQELQLERDGLMVRAIPDVLAVWHDTRPPLILDWKVNSFGSRDARAQLALYALSLTQGRLVNKGPQNSGFPPSLKRWKTEEVRLIEVQLLSKQQRSYTLSEEDVEDVESLLCANISQLRLASEQLAPKEWEPMQFSSAQYAETCASCSFRKPCWDGVWRPEVKASAKAKDKAKAAPKPRRKIK